MKYFVENSGRKGTCYHEFYKGKWDGATFRKDDSVFLHDDTLDQCGGLVEALMLIIPSYDRYGPTEVFAVDWEKIGKAIRHSDKSSAELYEEASEWAAEIFKTEECFTILGI